MSENRKEAALLEQDDPRVLPQHIVRYSNGSVNGVQLCDRDSWLEARKQFIGASDAGALMGLNPWKTNVELWREKTGIAEPPDISDKPAVRYGIESEDPIRALFEIDHPEYRVFYKANNMFINSDYPFAHASLDGWLKDSNGRMGVLEIKTTEIQNSFQWHEWDGRIPSHYYAQTLWQMMVTGWDFVILRARIKYHRGDDLRWETRDYIIPRYEDEIRLIAEAGRAFAEAVRTKTEPALILPEIGV